MNIDSHQHFWQFDAVRDAWITDEMEPIRRDFMPDDLKPLLTRNNIHGVVSVQADQSDTETDFLLSLARQYDFIMGVVGWTDLRSAELSTKLDELSDHSLLKGFRHILQAEPKGFMLEKDFIHGINTLSRRGYTYDVLIYEDQLDEAVEMIEKLPEMPLVIDHMAKPRIREFSFLSWRKGMQRLAEHPHVNIKLSGMVTEANPENWNIDDLRPYFETILDLFTPDRIMFGSDWPVCLMAADYKEVVDLTSQFIDTLSRSEQEKIMGSNTLKFYNL